VLTSLDWSGPARRLLEAARELNPGRPAVMHIRHTARVRVSTEEIARNSGRYDGLALQSTRVGIQAAIDFGSALPKGRRYTLYHTPVERTRETAQAIDDGIDGSGGSALATGVTPLALVDPEAASRLAVRRGWNEKDGSYEYSCHWLAGLIPETIRRPSAEFARDYAGITMENLSGASPDAFHIYVSHDTLVAAIIFHWFGVPPYSDGIRYLEGLLMQVGDDGLHVWLRDRYMVCELPYWWPCLDKTP